MNAFYLESVGSYHGIHLENFFKAGLLGVDFVVPKDQQKDGLPFETPVGFFISKRKSKHHHECMVYELNSDNVCARDTFILL